MVGLIIFDEEEQYLKLQKSGFDKFINTKDLTILAKHYLHIDKIPLSEIRVKLVTFVTNFNPNFRPIKYEKQLTNAINLAVANYQIYNPLISFSKNEIDYIRDKQIMRTKSIINKIPLKVSVISVIFFIPLLLLLILSPVIIEYFG